MPQYDGYVRISTQNDTSDAIKATEELGDKIAEAMDPAPVDKVSESFDNVGQAALKTGDIIKANLISDVVLKGIQQLGAGLKDAAVHTVDIADGLDSSSKRIAAATNATEAELKSLEAVVEQVYRDNFGEGFDDIADSVSVIKKNLGEMDDSQLVNITESAFALREVFGYGVAESSRAAKAIQDNFNVSAAEAYDYIARGAQNGLDFSGELLDSISEYSVQFKKFGFDINDMFNIMEAGAENGAWKLDTVGDIIKEMSITAIDGSDSTREAFESLGLNADEMSRKFAAGGETARRAYEDTIAALKNMEDPIEQDAAGVGLMKTMWEDLGKEAVFALTNITDSAYEASGAMEGIKDLSYTSLDDSIGSMHRQIDLLIEPIGEELIPSIERVTEAVGEAAEAGDLTEVAGGIGQFVSGTLTLLLENIKLIGAGLAGATAGVVAFKTASVITKVVSSWQAAALQVTLFSNAQGVAALKTAALNGTLTKQEIIYAVLSGKLDAATAKQAMLNTTMAANPAGAIAAAIGLLVSGLTLFSMSAGESTDKVQELADAAREAHEAAKEYAESADKLRNIQDEYERISKTVTYTTEKEEALRDVQQQLIDQYGEQANGINLVNGKYDEEIGKLDTLISQKEKLAKVENDIARRNILAAQKEKTEVGDSSWSNFLFSVEAGKRAAIIEAAYDYAKKNLSTFDETDISFGSFKFTGNFEDRAEDLRNFYDYLTTVADSKGEYILDLQNEVAEQYSLALENAALLNELTEEESVPEIDTHKDDTNSVYDPSEYYRNKDLEAQKRFDEYQAKLAEQYAQYAELYDKERKAAKYSYDMGEMDAATYYATLAQLRDDYLQVGSEEWQDANVELQKYYNSLTEDQQKALTKAYNEEKSLLQYKLRTGKLSEEQYYKELAKIRDKYLDKNSEAWRSAYLETYEYNQQIVQANKDALTQLLSDASDTTLSALENITAARDSLTLKLVDFNKTFEKISETVPETIAVKGDFKITTAEHEVEVYRMGADSIEDNIKVLEEYGAMLDALKARGADDDTLNNILAMDVDEAMEFGSSLLSMSDMAWNDYFGSMAKLRQTAADISARYYQSEVDSLRENFIDKMRSELEGLGSDMYLVGADVAAEFVAGWNEALGTKDLTIGQLMRSLSGTVSTAPAAAQQMITTGTAAADKSSSGNGSITNHIPVYIGSAKVADVMIDAVNGEMIRTGKNVLLT